MMGNSGGQIGKEAMDAFAKSLDFDWAKSTDKKLSAASKRLNAAVRKAQAEMWTSVKGPLKTSALKTAKATAKSTVKTFNLNVSGSLRIKDTTALARSIDSGAHYLRDFFLDQVSPQLAAQMRGIVTSGLYHGIGPEAMTTNLSRRLAGGMAKYSRSYLNVVANAVTGRARSFSQLTSYKGAGIQSYEISAVQDQVTTPFCRMVDGMILNVQRGLNRYAATDALADPRGVQFTQPWVSERTIKSGADEGKKGLYIKAVGDDKLAGVIERSGYGTSDDRGTFSKQMSPNQLMDANIGPPPYHARCRTTTMPVVT
jgi:SPP1 gp7 family putative phage head morphogenesis protein